MVKARRGSATRGNTAGELASNTERCTLLRTLVYVGRGWEVS